MQPPRVWRQALLRIAAVVGVLGITLGGLHYWMELKRLDGTVVLLAQREAESFVDKHLRGDAIDLGDPRLANAVRQTLLEHFPIVEFYDLDRRKRLEVIAPGKESIESALRDSMHGFPDGRNPVYHRIDVLDTTLIQVLIPLPIGIFEGVYEVDAATIAEIKRSMVRAVLGIILSVVATGVLLLPLLVGLNREVVRTSTAMLTGNIELLEVLGSAIATRDVDTSAHNYRVTLYAIELARAVKFPDSGMRGLIAGSFLHDVGKIGVPDSILSKPGKLDAEEVRVMETHVEQGGQILQKSSWLGTAREVVLNHHEKFNGTGYPCGLGGEAIPLAARIFAIVDVFDALTSRRPYKAPMSLDDSLAILKADAGSHFDPVLIDAFARIAPNVYRRLTAMSDAEVEAQLRRITGGYFVLA